MPDPRKVPLWPLFWTRNLNGSWSKFGLWKLLFMAVTEPQKLPISGSAGAGLQDSLLGEPKCCQSNAVQRNSVLEVPRGKQGWQRMAHKPRAAALCWNLQTISADCLNQLLTHTRNIPSMNFPLVMLSSKAHN